MRRTIVLAALLALAAQHAAAATLDRVRQAGVFKIGYRADARPHSFRNEQGQPAGYIVDLCREVAVEVAAQVGGAVRAEYVVVPADQRFEAVRDGKIDILCDPSSITMARRELVDFSIPTFLDGAGVLSRANWPVNRFEDLTGKRVGVLAGTTSERTLRDSLAGLKVNATVIAVRDHRDGLDRLAADAFDAYFADRAIIAAMLQERGRPGFALNRPYFSYETYGLALPRDDGAFRLLVDRTLTRLYRSGKVDAILAKTFGAAPPDEMLKSMILIHAVPEQ
jgi:ABC-type amino acid transport substrate-binding protein